jgi:glycosyltransferase involved in cell wall biosynthesis
MRILHVPPPLSRQGNTLMTVAEELGRQEISRGDQVGVIVSHNRDARPAGLDNLIVDYTTYCPRQWFTANEVRLDTVAGRFGRRRRRTADLFLPAIDAAAAWQPDLVLLYEGVYAATSLPDWRRALPDASIVLYLHSALSRSYGRRELARVLDACDHVVCVSNFLRSATVARVPEAAGKVTAVLNGVDLDTFRPAEPGAAGAAGDGVFSVLFAGQIAPHKGPDRLIRALGTAAALTDKPLRATIVGSSAYDAGDQLTEYERSLRSLAKDSGAEVTFVPFVGRRELVELYRQASIVCMPSVFDDPFPLVALEAMACGTALVASRRGGLTELGGDVAVFIDPDDIAGFGATLADLAEHPEVVETLGARSRDRLIGRTWQETNRRLVAVCEHR